MRARQFVPLAKFIKNLTKEPNTLLNSMNLIAFLIMFLLMLISFLTIWLIVAS
jgi:hypothetical protein